MMPLTRFQARSSGTLDGEENFPTPEVTISSQMELNNDHMSDSSEPSDPLMNTSNDPDFSLDDDRDRVLNATESERVKSHLRKLHKKYVSTLNTALTEIKDSWQYEFTERHRSSIQEHVRVFTDVVQNVTDKLRDEQSSNLATVLVEMKTLLVATKEALSPQHMSEEVVRRLEPLIERHNIVNGRLVRILENGLNETTNRNCEEADREIQEPEIGGGVRPKPGTTYIFGQKHQSVR